MGSGGKAKTRMTETNSIVFHMNFINTIPEGVGEKELIQIIYEQRFDCLHSILGRAGHGELQTNLKLFFVSFFGSYYGQSNYEAILYVLWKMLKIRSFCICILFEVKKIGKGKVLLEPNGSIY